MSINPAEFVLILTGKATPELNERFLREADVPESDLRKMLRDAQKWAAAKMNPNCPSPPATGEVASANRSDGIRITRRAAFWDQQDDQPSLPATERDLAEFIRGTASRETSARVRRDLEDPTSKVWQIVEQLANEDE